MDFENLPVYKLKIMIGNVHGFSRCENGSPTTFTLSIFSSSIPSSIIRHFHQQSALTSYFLSLIDLNIKYFSHIHSFYAGVPQGSNAYALKL